MHKLELKKIKGNIYLSILFGVMGISLFGGGMSVPVFDGADIVRAAEADDLSIYPVSENRLEPVEITGENDISIVKRGATYYDPKYDPRNVNGVSMVTPVRNQAEYDTCWAFALVAAAESNLIKNGYADATIDLSENQFAYFFYNRQTDSLGNTVGDLNNCNPNKIMQYGTKAWAYNGGTIQGAALAMATWTGLTTEIASPYISDPDKSLCYAHDFSVRDMFFYDYDINAYEASVSRIKQAIVDHGAVAAGIFMNLVSYGADKKAYISDYYNNETGAYYYNQKDGNHAVVIVGWDDAYSRENFGKIKPSRNGAWIVKNSYGTNMADGSSLADNGFFYVSYEDASLSEIVALEMIPLSMQYDNNYQYDGTGAPIVPMLTNMYGQKSDLPNGTKYANVFTAKASASACEELKAVSVCTFSANTNYTVDIYTGLTSAAKPTSGTKAVSFSGLLVNAGYQTLELPMPVALVPGENFSVVVTLSGTSSAAKMGSDGTGSAKNGWISFQASGAANQSFVFYGNKWTDYYSSARGNLRIKAFTNFTNISPFVGLSDKSLGLSKGSSKKLSLQKNPENIFRDVISWKSSNKKVATVNKKGKVKAVSYGTAKISATIVKDSKKATLKCKLTVGPAKLKGFKVSGGKNKISVKWKANRAATGYTVYYSADKDSGYKKLADIGKASTAKCTKKKIGAGTYYVKMRPYLKKGKTKLYGSYTSVKQVYVK